MPYIHLTFHINGRTIHEKYLEEIEKLYLEFINELKEYPEYIVDTATFEFSSKEDLTSGKPPEEIPIATPLGQ